MNKLADLFNDYYSNLEIPKPPIATFNGMDVKFKLGIMLDFFNITFDFQVLIGNHGYKVFVEGLHDVIETNGIKIVPLGHEPEKECTVIIFSVDKEIKPIEIRARECISLLTKIINEPF